jgi:hypothetical protein
MSIMLIFQQDYDNITFRLHILSRIGFLLFNVLFPSLMLGIKICSIVKPVEISTKNG